MIKSLLPLLQHWNQPHYLFFTKHLLRLPPDLPWISSFPFTFLFLSNSSFILFFFSIGLTFHLPPIMFRPKLHSISPFLVPAMRVGQGERPQTQWAVMLFLEVEGKRAQAASASSAGPQKMHPLLNSAAVTRNGLNTPTGLISLKLSHPSLCMAWYTMCTCTLYTPTKGCLILLQISKRLVCAYRIV